MRQLIREPDPVLSAMIDFFLNAGLVPLHNVIVGDVVGDKRPTDGLGQPTFPPTATKCRFNRRFFQIHKRQEILHFQFL